MHQSFLTEGLVGKPPIKGSLRTLGQSYEPRPGSARIGSVTHSCLGFLGRGAVALGLMVALSGCRKHYRVGEHVLVIWEEDRPPYPAYITEQKGKNRYRVHFEGYDSRWDDEVGIDRIVGRVEGPVSAPPPPRKVELALKENPQASESALPVAPYKTGDRVRVRWRGSMYPATVVRVVAPDRFLVHYEGYENAWDEVVDIERIGGRK